MGLLSKLTGKAMEAVKSAPGAQIGALVSEAFAGLSGLSPDEKRGARRALVAVLERLVLRDVMGASKARDILEEAERLMGKDGA